MPGITRLARRLAAAGAGVAAATYAAYVGVTWASYGHASAGDPAGHDELLDRFMPRYEVAERHHLTVAAPAAVTLDAARDADLYGAPGVRAIVNARALLLGAASVARPASRGLLAEMQALGWVVLAEIPGQEVVVGAVTRPWEANVLFRSIPSPEFAAFNEPGYVKIAWTLRADVRTATGSVLRTETRALATDRVARRKFRRYWAFLSPGIIVIRWMLLGSIKADAETRSPRRVP